MANFIQKLNPFFQIQKQYADVKKQLEIYKRAEQPYSSDYNYAGTLIPLYPYALDSIYQLAFFSDILTTVHRSLRTQMFKNGYEVIKSADTDEYVIDVDEEELEPNDDDRVKILRFAKRANKMGQEIEEVLKELEDDLNIMDLYFCNFRFDYYFDGKELHKELLEVQRVDPRTMSLVMNNRRQFAMDDKGRQISFSIMEREHALYDTDTDKYGMPTIPAWYKQTRNGSECYYGEHEFVMSKRYRPSELLGFSPVVALWQKVRTLQQQDKYIMELYEGKRPPKGLLAFNTTNKDSLKEAWDEMLKKAKINPHLPSVLGISNNGQGKFVEFVDFMKSLDELQFTEQRDEFRRVIGSVYGVSPVFQGDMSTGGGLNNEGLQITVTNDVVQDGQHNYNNKLLKKITKDLGCHGWAMLLKPSEEQDEMAQLSRQEQSLRNGEIASRMGLTVKYDSRQDKCVIDDGEITAPPEQEDMFANPFEDSSEPKDDGDNNPEEVKSDSQLDTPVFKSVKKKVNEIYKSLPSGAVPLGSRKVPKGYKEIKGPKGGRYAIPNDEDSKKEELLDSKSELKYKEKYKKNIINFSNKIKQMGGKFEDLINSQSQEMFRGGTNLSQNDLTDAGISISTHRHIAEDFAQNKGGKVKEFVISSDAKIVDYRYIPDVDFKEINDYSPELDSGNENIWSQLEFNYQKAIDWAKKKGFDVVKLPLEGELRVINPSVLFSKDELMGIWEGIEPVSADDSGK